MMASRKLWMEAQRGGELTRFGSWPEDCPDEFPRTMLDGYTRHSNTWEDLSSERRDYLKGLVETYQKKLEEAQIRMESDEWVFPQAWRVLSNLWGSIDPWCKSATMAGKWGAFAQHMRGKWSFKMLRTLVLLATIVGCQIPLSAALWTRESFVDVRIYGLDLRPADDVENNPALGLLARHAIAGPVKDMLWVRRHFDFATCLLDTVILEPLSRMPVGIVPDL